MSWFPMPKFGFGTDYQALTEQQISAQMAAQARMMQNAGWSNPYHPLMANYRPPVVVPEGWAEWFEHGDEVHT